MSKRQPWTDIPIRGGRGGADLKNYGGIVNINKPVGITSFSVISILRRKFGLKKIGHIGTLDPFADGVLPVCIGRATGMIRYMEDFDKKYALTVAFGKRTDSRDVTGKVIAENPPSQQELKRLVQDDFKELREIILAMKGKILQEIPMYSAKKVDGVPLYKLARQNIEIERDKKEIEIFDIKIEDFDLVGDELSVVLHIHSSKGAYMRTIADDIGLASGYYAYAKALTRTAAGPFKLEEAIVPDILDAFDLSDPPFGREDGMFRTDFALSHLPVFATDDTKIRAFIQGKALRLEGYENSDKQRLLLYNEQEVFIGVIKCIQDEKGIFRAERIYANEY